MASFATALFAVGLAGVLGGILVEVRVVGLLGIIALVFSGIVDAVATRETKPSPEATAEHLLNSLHDSDDDNR